MGQSEILNLLEEVLKPMTSKEIAELTNLTSKNVATNLKRLIDNKEVYYIELDSELAMNLYGCKHKIRIYFCPGAIINSDFVRKLAETLL